MGAVADPEGPISAVAQSIAQAVAQHRASPPSEKNLTRAGCGAFLVVACIYTAVWAEVFLGDSFGDLLSSFVHAPLHPPIALVIWLAVGAFALLWLRVGLRGPLGPYGTMEKFWAGFRVALFACALIWRWYIPYDQGWGFLINLVLRGLYFAFLAEALMEFLLTLRATGGSAASMVAAQIERTSILWRIGRHRKF
jgi:hypothetical protein